MPFTKHPRIAKTFGRLAVMTAFGVLASSGVAAAATCATPPVSTPFSHFGDKHNYFLVRGGDFEGSSLPAGWTVSGASLTPGGDPFAAGDKSLTIQAGGSVTTAYTCIDSTMPSMRFFARQAAAGSNLKVEVLVKLPGNATITLPLGELANGSMSSWGPSPSLTAPGGRTVPPGITLRAALRFSVPGNAGTWQIDNVYADPYSFG